ncbi:GNAT family N-acetyltransferase [Alkalicella caledoniensis]|uniref:GNAT family N-acetyltransferase n=2 Tax=Alkalicella caledoniensis TaxID=2731377 RepID=A0A7G9WD52_ALKCA|nr:GNAT family N-acetyltransferase [Alkalicella caledoniensis]
MEERDIETIHQVFSEHKIGKSLQYITRCWKENSTGERITLLAFLEGKFVGSLHLLDKSLYPYFEQRDIPEINDFNVIPPYRKNGIGNLLMEEIEKIAFDKYKIVGIGVGLYPSYSSAQRLYAKRGYIPDGQGLTYNLKPVEPGSNVRVDDDLNLFFIKKP